MAVAAAVPAVGVTSATISGHMANLGARISDFISDKIEWTTDFFNEKSEWISDKVQSISEFMAKVSLRISQFISFIRTMVVFFSVVVLMRIIIGIFQNPLKYILLGVAIIPVTAMYICTFLLSIPPFVYLAYIVLWLFVSVLPWVLIIVFNIAFFCLIFVFVAILAVINYCTGGALKYMVLCQNPPSAWFTTPNHHLGNRYIRGLFCSKPCMEGYRPDMGPSLCRREPMFKPAYCPEAEIMRLYTKYKNDKNFMYKDFPTVGNLRYLSQNPIERRRLLARYYGDKVEYLSKCNKEMQEHKTVPLHVCMSLDVLEDNELNQLSKQTVEKLRRVCQETYCTANSNYPFCNKRPAVNNLHGAEIWKNIIKILITTMVFGYVLNYTLEYLYGIDLGTKLKQIIQKAVKEAQAQAQNAQNNNNNE